MAVIKYGAIVTSGSGSLGGSTLQAGHSAPIWRNKPQQTFSRTQAQSIIRGYNKKMQAGWRSLSYQGKQIWNDWARTHRILSVKPDKHVISGHSLWMKYQFPYCQANLNFLVDPYWYVPDPASTETQAVYTAMPDKPDDQHLYLMNIFVNTLVAAGLWSTAIDRLYVLCYNSGPNAMINWINPGSGDSALVGAPTFTINRGYSSFSTAKYINTFFVPLTDGVHYTTNNAGLILFNNTDSIDTGVEYGCSDASMVNGIALNTRYTNGNSIQRLNTSGFAQGVCNDSRGMYFSDRTAANQTYLYRNLTQTINSATLATGLTSFPMPIGVANLGGGILYPSLKQISFFSLGRSLINSERKIIFDAFKAMMQPLGLTFVP